MNYCQEINAAGLLVMFLWGCILGWLLDKFWLILRSFLDL